MKMGYLANTRLENKDRCEYASKASGMNVEFRNHPMPKDYSDPDDEFYHPESMAGVYGSVYTNEGFVDHSKFWRCWDEYQG
jgi:hypothetical protein